MDISKYNGLMAEQFARHDYRAMWDIWEMYLREERQRISSGATNGYGASFRLPEWDAEKKRPKTKMPNCPNCGHKELKMIESGLMACYHCGLSITWKAT